VKNKVYIETYGCTANQNDSQIMAGILKNSGYNLTKIDEADYVILNSCGVKSSTEEKIINKLEKLAKTNKKLIITGCLTKINPNRIKKTIPNFSAMLDTKSVDKIAETLSEIRNGTNSIIKTSAVPKEKPTLPTLSFNNVVHNVQVSEGCLSNCSFCGSKLARGNLKSYRPENIRSAIGKSLKNGFKEIHLTSQDMSAYGRDIGTNLSELLESITKVEGNFITRIGMMNPLHFKKMEVQNLIRAYKNKKVFKFLHLCLQSGSNSILNKMKRGYKIEEFLDYIDCFKKEIPEITIWTDIIVGHPGETKRDFIQTLEIIEKVRPDFVNVSSYGNRLGTKATEMKQISSEVKKERTKKLSKLTKRISLEKNKKWLGWIGLVLIDEYNEEKQNHIARNYAYKQIAIKNANLKLGEFVKVKIIDAKETCLIGKCFLQGRIRVPLN
jgi:threonylcarbamoyladenosine tRNA methylthiotransferase CDKAL1